MFAEKCILLTVKNTLKIFDIKFFNITFSFSNIITFLPVQGSFQIKLSEKEIQYHSCVELLTGMYNLGRGLHVKAKKVGSVTQEAEWVVH